MQPSMKYRFDNKAEKSITVIVEPWAEEVVVGPGSSLVLKIFNKIAGDIHTEISNDFFIICLWPGSRVEISLDGKDQTPSSLSIPAVG